MLPGANCQSCHSPGNLPEDLTAAVPSRRRTVAEDNLNWTIAGTAFVDILGSGPLSGASIQITDANGQVVSLTTNSAGNFYSAKAITPPLSATITAGGVTHTMTDPVSTGACNSCHHCDGPPGGKLYGGEQAAPAQTPTPSPCATPAPGTFSSIDSSILQPSCALGGCHGHGSAAGGLNLDTDNAYANLVNVSSVQVSSMPRVTPGDPSNSYLWHKLQGDQKTIGGTGSQMPIGSTLTSSQLESVQQWITDDALNN